MYCIGLVPPTVIVDNTHRLHYTAELAIVTAGVNTAALSVGVTASVGVSPSA